MTATQIGDGPVVYLLWFNLIFGLSFLKPVCFFQTSSIIEVGCRDGAVVRTLASHQCGLEASFKQKVWIMVTIAHLGLRTMLVDNPRYKKLVEKHPHLKGVTMDDNDERPRLPVHIILGNSECPRISTTEPQRVGREWDPVASYTKLGWTITSPGREIDTTSMLLSQTSRVDYEEFL